MESRIRRLITREHLPEDYASVVERYFSPIAVRTAAWRKTAGRCLTVGICGPQGSGKTTLCVFLEALLAGQGIRAARVSLDDFYLTRAQREDLARRVHPLFATRGVPGTHDTALGISVLERLAAAAPGGKNAPDDAQVRIPRFDKAVDDRKPELAWDTFASPADVILFEGWCVGARPQAAEDLAAPVNALERDLDPDGTWRRAVNDALAGPYQDLFSRMDRLILILPPDFAYVREWRALQERKLRASTGRGMSDQEIARFVMYYERITRAVMAEMPPRADLVLEIGPDQRPTAARWKEDP